MQANAPSGPAGHLTTHPFSPSEAQKLGLTPLIMEQCRRRVLSVGGGPRPADDDVLWVVAWFLAESDTQAADHLGVSQSTFSHWARRHGLPTKGRFKFPPLPEGSDLEAAIRHYNADAEVRRRKDAWQKANHFKDGAERVGIFRTAFGVWARGAGLVPKAALHDPGPGGRDERYMRAYRESATDAEAARLVGTSEVAFARWRRRLGLEPTSKAHRAALRASRKDK
ncbi:MAG TPA: hypothetical protein VFH47_08930 [Candidatus Thermoplasmatota archaeon]|nr:hypothetical protein [Candidatus Thermoplasmatota archaeon]